MTLTISSLSVQYVRAPVAAELNGAVYNPTSDTVQFAFMAVGATPASGDWHAGSWETVTGPPAQYIARCLVGGTAGVVLTAGTYVVWLKVTDNPEVPVAQVGVLTVAAF